jgi:VIT1/CCC1 family predicted Fe2+/Mn2+ transporter
MKVAGFSLLLAGWLLVLAALVLLRSLRAQTAFVLAGLAVEALGLVLAVRSHLAPRPDRR